MVLLLQRTGADLGEGLLVTKRKLVCWGDRMKVVSLGLVRWDVRLVAE